MYSVKKITSQNANEAELIYNDFYMRAYTEFGFEVQPLEFKDLVGFIDKGFVNILAVYEQMSNVAKGILIYAVQPDVVELSVIHCLGEDKVGMKSALVQALKDELKGKGHKTISYAMLGVQSDFVRQISNFGFEFVGQAVVKFGFDDKSVEIFNKASVADFSAGFEVINWDDKYAMDVVKLINTSFDGMQDVKFDPRFSSLEGCEDILAKIIQNIYGEFLPDRAKVLLQNGVPKGFCLVNLTTPSVANIPLIGVDKELKNKGLGTLLLQSVLADAIPAVMSGQFVITELNATVDTDNLSAIRMYRKLGFVEDSNYPQAYCRLF